MKTREKVHLSQKTIEGLRALSGEDPNFLQKLLTVFQESSDTRIQMLRQSITQGNAAQVKKEAHLLKSGAFNVGAEILGSLSVELESLGESGSLENVEELFDQLCAEYQIVVQEIKRVPKS